MKQIAWIFILAAACTSGAFAQTGNVVFQSAGGIVTARAIGGVPLAPVTGAPYSATMRTEMVQTLSDGTHITQTTTGTVARDADGRIRQDAPLPSFGNLLAANAPHLVFIQDPIAQVSYILDLANKTAQKMPVPPPGADAPSAATVAPGKDFFFIQSTGASISTAGPAPLPPCRRLPRRAPHPEPSCFKDPSKTMTPRAPPPKTLARRPCRASVSLVPASPAPFQRARSVTTRPLASLPKCGPRRN